MIHYIDGALESQPIKEQPLSISLKPPLEIFYLRSIIAPNKITAINGIVKIVICTPAFCFSSQSIIFEYFSCFISKLIFINIFGIRSFAYS